MFNDVVVVAVMTAAAGLSWRRAEARLFSSRSDKARISLLDPQRAHARPENPPLGRVASRPSGTRGIVMSRSVQPMSSAISATHERSSP